MKVLKKIFPLLLVLLLAFSAFAFSACDVKTPETPGGGDGPVIDDGDDDPDYSDDGEEVDTTNWDTPETGFAIDGAIDTAEQDKYVVLGQRYGVEGQTIVSYYIGKKGLYFHFEVKDKVLFKGNADENAEDTSPYILDSDRVELFVDTKADGGTSPKTDDYQIMMTLEGYNQVLKGDGSRFVLKGALGLDAVKAVFGPNSTVSKRDKNATKVPSSSKDVDSGYSIEAFMSYKNFGFTKKEIYKVSVGQADMYHVKDAQRFNVAGSNTTPNEFRTLSQYGFGTQVALENGINIDGKKDDFYKAENVNNSTLFHFTATRAYAQLAQNGNMTTETYVHLGQNGLYLYMNATSEKTLKYYYAEFPYQSDHAEIRIDVNNSESSDTKDIWYFMDIMGAGQSAYGINNDSRTVGNFDVVATTAYTGEIVNNAGTPMINIGSTDPKTFTYEVFLPWYSLGIDAGKTFGMMLACGNPNEGVTGIGNVFYADANYSVTEHWHTFEKYKNYTKFTRPTAV